MAFAAQAQAQTATDLPVRVPGSPSPLPSSEAPKPKPPPVPPPPAPDGLGQNGFYLEADTLTRDDRNNVWMAAGQVEARYQGRVVRADTLTYNVVAGTVTADGHAQIINTDGTVLSGDHVLMDDKMRAGFVKGFSAHEPFNITFAADVAVRRSETVNELNRAVFTPCDICAPDGSHIEPTWSISASKVVQDRERRLVTYRDAVLRVKGIPIFYAPVFWHPDPSSPRASGLLVPTFSYSNKLGMTYQQPYLQVISPSEELVIDPQFDTKVNPILNLEWTKRFYSGIINARVGVTYGRDFDSNGNQFGPQTFRSYILANGAFDLTKAWSWGFNAERTSDPLLFDKYNIANVYEQHGPFAADNERLVSDIYVTRQDTNSYLSISAVSFQGLRQVSAGVTEDNRAFPLVAPLIEGRYDVPFSVAGGSLRILGSAVVLTRDQQLQTATGPTDNSRRATGEIDWLRTFTLSNGIRLNPFVNLRGDVYNIDNLSASNAGNHTVSRGQATAGLNLTWPFIRQQGSQSVVLEPIAQFLVSPSVKANANIPNEDSLVFTYDETDLFDPNKFPGYDVFDGGARMNLGGRATFDWGGGRNLVVVAGRTLRADTTNIYPAATGLNRTASDWVVAADTTPIDGLTLFSRALLGDQYGIDRLEVGADFAYQRFRGYIRYDIDNTIPAQTVNGIVYGGKINDLEYGGEVFVTKHWGVSLAGIHDLVANDWRMRDIGLIYKDDCIRADVVYQHEDTIEGRLGKSDAVFLRLTLATLADEGYKNADFR
ncbi:MAG: LPS assembly protein LptD [Caulobacteraceae bacterium]|nr:LPS assembly protein LptD [Caulobacteraceae bacterium]